MWRYVVLTFLMNVNSWVARDVIVFIKCKTKEPPKLLSSSDLRGSKFISVNNFSTQEYASSKNRHSLNFRVMAVCEKKIY